MQPGRVSPDQLFTNRAERRNGFARNNCRGVSGRRCPLIPATAPLDRTADPPFWSARRPLNGPPKRFTSNRRMLSKLATEGLASNGAGTPRVTKL